VSLAGAEAVPGLAEVLPKVDLGHLLEDEAVQVASCSPDSPVGQSKNLFFWFKKNANLNIKIDTAAPLPVLLSHFFKASSLSPLSISKQKLRPKKI
jgi:hypothetical protein